MKQQCVYQQLEGAGGSDNGSNCLQSGAQHRLELPIYLDTMKVNNYARVKLFVY